MSIKIKVAFCTECKGYHSATPAEEKYRDHDDITDHFFYHGEPWFTLDPETFEKALKLENTEVKIMSLTEHAQHDHLYCHCSKRRAKRRHFSYEYFDTEAQLQTEKKSYDTDYDFRDLYYTSNQFHPAKTTNT
ncbi:hypothetical protein VUJ46_22365 [Chryseobacterium sp. MYb264]|uniref:hypothetical protein n=1 Tax=Chryseobacterium sp. MYb264 TaxID=2745153 RepID=UPI002E0EBF5C|nr:hypothetical protein VUJ46_22365 [Chryseobacterium sp. MYb264]